LLLILAHLVAGITSAGAASPSGAPGLATVVFAGVFFGQVSLLAIWVALGSGHLILRVLGLIAGCIYLYSLFRFGARGSSDDAYYLLVGSGLVVVLPALLVGWCWGAIRYQGEGSFAPVQLRFNIRHLFVLTGAVAALLGLFRWLEDREYWSLLISISLAFGGVGLGVAWAVMRLTSPGVQVALAAAFVMISASIMTIATEERESFFLFGPMTGIEALTIVVSLWTVRSAGYQFVFYRSAAVGAADPASVVEPSGSSLT
jgi:hypothetical protein